MAPIFKNGKKVKSEIHCPVSGCLYAYGSERYFTEKKLLNQHFAKVHAEKKYSCTKCNKSFGLDWWRRHHEKTCGIEWKCNCGVKYTSRESLLTHSRRSQHELPDYVFSSDKTKQSKMNVKSAETPMIVIVEPIIQNLTCIQQVPTSFGSLRPILPKTTLPLLLTVPMPMNVVPNVTSPVNSSPVTLQSASENVIFNTLTSTGGQTLPMSNPFIPASDQSNNDNDQKNQKPLCKTVSTQTANKFDCAPKSRQSRASQCVRRKQKSEVGIESTHTQTAESAVVKIKKRRSRRKSVAITTEPNILGNSLISEQSLWPGLNDFICQDSLESRSVKNSASTQTLPSCESKMVCDSETITEDDLFRFHFGSEAKKDSIENGNSPFELLSDMTPDAIGNLPENLDNNALPVLNMFDNHALSDNAFVTEGQKCDENRNFSGPVEKQIETSASSVFSMFDECMKPEIENKLVPPISSNMHTQTIDTSVLQYNLLANMETQTTDDFIFSDLEFSDTETQTPWDDFPSIDDSPLQAADQLSIEIQTDFSDLPSSFSQDPYEFINGMDVQNVMNGCSNKETMGVNIETQTQDWFSFPQLTNSESQTLDIESFVFDALN